MTLHIFLILTLNLTLNLNLTLKVTQSDPEFNPREVTIKKVTIIFALDFDHGQNRSKIHQKMIKNK